MLTSTVCSCDIAIYEEQQFRDSSGVLFYSVGIASRGPWNKRVYTERISCKNIPGDKNRALICKKKKEVDWGLECVHVCLRFFRKRERETKKTAILTNPVVAEEEEELVCVPCGQFTWQCRRGKMMKGTREVVVGKVTISHRFIASSFLQWRTEILFFFFLYIFCPDSLRDLANVASSAPS